MKNIGPTMKMTRLVRRSSPGIRLEPGPRRNPWIPQSGRKDDSDVANLYNSLEQASICSGLSCKSAQRLKEPTVVTLDSGGSIGDSGGVITLSEFRRLSIHRLRGSWSDNFECPSIFIYDDPKTLI